MSKRKDAGEDATEAELGNFDAFKSERPETLDAHRKSLKELAELRSIPGILVDGMFDKDLVIVRVRAKNGSSAASCPKLSMRLRRRSGTSNRLT